MPKTVAIVGAGPAGLMAAEKLSAAGLQVTIYEGMHTAARKFLMAGRGGLNLTHSEPFELFVTRYREAQVMLAPLIAEFSPLDLRAWCEALGQETYVGTSGRVFPRAMKASPLLRAWLIRLQQQGVTINYGQRWIGWRDDALLFRDQAGVEASINADAILLALGGASWPRLGADGSWQKILAARGVDIVPLRPANCGFVIPWSPIFREKYAGQPLKTIILTSQEQDFQGESIITKQGMEGGVVYAASALLREQIEKQGKAQITIDLKPDLSVEQLRQRLQKARGRDSLSNHLRKVAGLSPVAVGLVQEILHQKKGLDPVLMIKALPLVLTATAGLERAISSAGGVPFSEINSSFMLKRIPGVFVAGEMLDWEAPTGGYLLQATFSTAVRAASGIQAFLNAGSRT